MRSGSVILRNLKLQIPDGKFEIDDLRFLV